VVGYLLHDKTYNSEDKLKILEIAKSIARAKGYHRVTWSDFATAINEFRRNKK
jgi:coproporphyrinogen III oxidase-like Fe-S oxidoreductase